MPPVIAIVGKSESGKTTLIEKLVRELKSRGYRVATIKHAAQGMSFDAPDKDSWRHIQAGSEATAVSSPDRMVLIKPVTRDMSLDEIVRFFGEDYDIILAEGFKQDNAPKIEVYRKEVGPPIGDTKKLIAIVTDENLEIKTRQFSLEDTKGLADLLEQGFLRAPGERVSLYINSIPISLGSFPKEMVANIVLALASSLKGVGEVSSLEIFLRREHKPEQEGR
jgi:molybdopterin-guanine dinucleotide biosynthesis protein B